VRKNLGHKGQKGEGGPSTHNHPNLGSFEDFLRSSSCSLRPLNVEDHTVFTVDGNTNGQGDEFLRFQGQCPIGHDLVIEGEKGGDTFGRLFPEFPNPLPVLFKEFPDIHRLYTPFS